MILTVFGGNFRTLRAVAFCSTALGGITKFPDRIKKRTDGVYHYAPSNIATNDRRASRRGALMFSLF
jgi:hypothetical protein